MNGLLGLPILDNVRIPPLRHPAPSRHVQAPPTLQLIDNTYLNDDDRATPTTAGFDEEFRGRCSRSAPTEAFSRDTKKPHLAISELVESPAEGDNNLVQLPSFVSLSVVEKSPTQAQLNLNHAYPHKRARLDTESDLLHDRDINRLLPRPIQKDDRQAIPLLPAMVTGLHEPPPSAALLPSMNDARPAIQRNATSMMQVKDMLQAENASNGKPPEQMLNTPEVSTAELPRMIEIETETLSDVDTPSTATSVTPVLQYPKKDPKIRRTRRKWTESETHHLLAGVKKHGFGKWKQILNDPAYAFDDRTSIDLKDRHRVFARDMDSQQEAANSDDALPDTESPGPGSKRTSSMSGNKQRRKRHPWNREEDLALLSGVQRYGFQWTDIHNDKDLKLTHRRATDLRDRIRNLYPEGYKHAEARPLRAEVKKAERAGKKETPAGTLYAPPGQMDSMVFSASGTSTPVTPIAEREAGTLKQRDRHRRQTTSGKVPSIAALTRSTEEDDAGPTARPAPRRSKTVADPSDGSGITLPSLALDAVREGDEWDNTLPPFINWEE